MIRAKSFEGWVRAHAAPPSAAEALALYDRFESDLWDLALEHCVMVGLPTVWELFDSLGEIESLPAFKQRLVEWAIAEWRRRLEGV